MDRRDEVLRREAPRSSQIWEEQPRSGGLDQSISSANTSSSVPSNQAGTRSVGVSAVTSRSEEHTSELQSLIRHSYAVFCLQQKQITTRQESSDDSTTANPHRE